MQICFEMSGGLGGLLATSQGAYRVDTEDPPDEQAQTLRRLVEESGLLGTDREALIPPHRQARDVLEYHLEVTTSGRSHRFDFDDTNVPARVRPLLEHLRMAATGKRLDGEAGM